MTRGTIAGGAFAAVLVLLAVAAGYRALNHHTHPAAATSPAITSSNTPETAETYPAAQTHPASLRVNAPAATRLRTSSTT